MLNVKEYTELVNWAETCIAKEDCNNCHYWEKCQTEKGKGSLTVPIKLLEALKEYHEAFNSYSKKFSQQIFQSLKESYKGAYSQALEEIERVSKNWEFEVRYTLEELGLLIPEEMKEAENKEKSHE